MSVPFLYISLNIFYRADRKRKLSGSILKTAVYLLYYQLALRAAHEMALEKPKSQILVGDVGFEPTAFSV